MERQYYIGLTFKTPEGPESIARFSAGNSRSRAAAIFRKLHGSRTVDEHNVILMDFVETNNGLPVNLDVIACTLDQLGANCKMISKELFKLYSLEPDTLKNMPDEKVY